MPYVSIKEDQCEGYLSAEQSDGRPMLRSRLFYEGGMVEYQVEPFSNRERFFLDTTVQRPLRYGDQQGKEPDCPLFEAVDDAAVLSEPRWLRKLVNELGFTGRFSERDSSINYGVAGPVWSAEFTRQVDREKDVFALLEEETGIDFTSYYQDCLEQDATGQ